MQAERVRTIAMSMPEATEQDHHGFPSFRVRGKIFVTWPDPAHLHVLLGEDGIREAVAADPDCCETTWWGKRLAACRVDLDAADEQLVTELITDAWRRKAPTTLRHQE